MGDAPTQGQGAELWEEPQEGQHPAPPTSRALAGGGEGAQEGASAEGCLCPPQVVQMQCNMDWLEERRQWHVRTAPPGKRLQLQAGGAPGQASWQAEAGPFQQPPLTLHFPRCPLGWGWGVKI